MFSSSDAHTTGPNSPERRKHTLDGDIVSAPSKRSGSWSPENISPHTIMRCDNKTPPPKTGSHVCPPTPSLAPPRSPWKKARRGNTSLNSTFEEDYFDEEAAMWTSGQHFNFEHGHPQSRSGTPNSLSEQAGRLSFGTLDLSGHSDLDHSACDSITGRLDASTLSPKASDNNISANSASNISQASTTKYSSVASPSVARRDIMDCPLSPAMSHAHKMNMSHGTPPCSSIDRTAHASFLSSLGTTTQVRLQTPVCSHNSPLNPLRLFNLGDMQAGSESSDHHTPVEGAEARRQSLMAAQITPGSGSFACHPRMQACAEQVQTRRNPFLGVDAVNDSPLKSSRLSLSRMMRLTVRSFKHDFFEFKEIGKGSFGTVYKCYRKIDLCPYAVKEIRTNTRSQKQRERLLKEIYAHSSQQDNVHVVRYYNAWEQDDMLYIQTELCDGTLAKLRAEHGPFNEEKLSDVLCQAAAGLAYMHAHNLAHMDLKPENMFWTERGVYKLGDFGLVTPADAGEHVDEGDQRYLSRELLQHDFCDLRKADIFALGMSMYELASDRPIPATGEDYQNFRDGSIPPLPSSIGAPLQELLIRMMHPDPSERPSAADVVRHPALFSLLRAESSACLRAEPIVSPRLSRTASAEGEQEGMIKCHLRALDAEKKVVSLEAMLKEAQEQLSLYKECVESALKMSGSVSAMPHHPTLQNPPSPLKKALF